MASVLTVGRVIMTKCNIDDLAAWQNDIAELAAWRKLALARGRILVAYRTGGAPPGKALDDSADACDVLFKLGIDSTTGKLIELEKKGGEGGE